jgi:hypothetical protein
MTLTKQEAKDAFKEAIHEWMDKKYREVGVWTVNAVMVALVVAVCYFILKLNGWSQNVPLIGR